MAEDTEKYYQNIWNECEKRKAKDKNNETCKRCKDKKLKFGDFEKVPKNCPALDPLKQISIGMKNAFIDMNKTISNITGYQAKKEAQTFIQTKAQEEMLKQLKQIEKQKTWKDKIKDNWKIYLTYGIFVVIISSIVSAVVPKIIDSLTQGPPCRIVTPLIYDQFKINKSSEFVLFYNVESIRNEKIRIEDSNAFCRWEEKKSTEKEVVSEESVPPLIQEFPEERPVLEEMGSMNIKTGLCKSPSKEGSYEIKIFVKTNRGICEKTVTMIVV